MINPIFSLNHIIYSYIQIFYIFIKDDVVHFTFISKMNIGTLQTSSTVFILHCSSILLKLKVVFH